MKMFKWLSILGCCFLLFFSYRLFFYINNLFSYPFEWEPTDGDHLNFIVRLLQHKPIFIDKSSGWVLSIYNPLYHYTAGMISDLFQTQNVLKVARQLSIFYTIIPSVVFFLSSLKKPVTSIFVNLFFALLILLPAVPVYLLDLTNVSPNSLMICLFVLTMFALDRAFLANPRNFIIGACISLMSLAVFMAKQQGVILFPIYIMSILFLQLDYKTKSTHIFITVFTVVFGVLLMEKLHGGIFLKSTLFDVGKLIQSDYRLAIDRLMSFFGNNIVFVFVGFYYSYLKFKDRVPDLWMLSFVMHLPFLIKILGNGGGGNNYFGTFWVTVVVINYKVISRLLYAGRYYGATSLFFLMLLNSANSLRLLNNDLDKYKPPTVENSVAYQKHFELIKSAIPVSSKPLNVLVNRNAAGPVNIGLDVNIEGSTTFQYLWLDNQRFGSKKILNNIYEKKYDLIFTGIQKYPVEIEEAIKKNYYVAIRSSVNIYYGFLGEVLVYSPVRSE